MVKKITISVTDENGVAKSATVAPVDFVRREIKPSGTGAVVTVPRKYLGRMATVLIE